MNCNGAHGEWRVASVASQRPDQACCVTLEAQTRKEETQFLLLIYLTASCLTQ